eukprot:15366340-Ditylum_brightwellii.AAC.1
MPSASLYHSAPPLKWMTRDGMDRERLTMDDEERHNFKLPPFPSEQGQQGLVEPPASHFLLK